MALIWMAGEFGEHNKVSTIILKKFIEKLEETTETIAVKH